MINMDTDMIQIWKKHLGDSLYSSPTWPIYNGSLTHHTYIIIDKDNIHC